MDFNRKRRQFCVYWAPDTADAEGQPTYKEPVQIKCRWKEDLAEIKKEGRSVYSQAKVNPEIEVKVGGVLFLGSMQDLQDIYPEATNAYEPFKTERCWEILHTKTTPDLKGRRFWYTAYL